MAHELVMKSLPKIVEVPVPKGNVHPEPQYHPILPMHEFTWGIISPKGTGKTTKVVNLLEMYKGYFHEIYIFSPTILNDDKWDYVKTLPLRSRNDRLLDFLDSLEEDEEKEDNDMFPDLKTETKLLREKFEPQVPENHFYTDYNEELLNSILNEQQEMIEFLRSHDKSKHWANRVLFVFDDLVGSDLFSNKRDNSFKIFNTVHRHKSISCFMISQGYKEVPKTIRTNWTCLSAFRIGNEKEVEGMYEEFPMDLKRLEWESVYQFATEGPHDFLFIDFQKPRGQQMMKNLDTILTTSATVEPGEELHLSKEAGKRKKKDVVEREELSGGDLNPRPTKGSRRTLSKKIKR